jgi:sugar lactone lactonase YvrE
VVAGGGLGDGAAALSVGLQPTSVLAAADGLWIADEQFNRVRFVADDGTIRSLVGSGAYGFNGDGLPALSSHLGIVADLALDAEGRLFLVDLANRQIRVLGADGTLRTFVGADHPLFTSVPGAFAPASVAIGSDGGVFVADRGTNVVWQFDPDGQGRRAAGNGTRGYAGDGGPSALGQLADPRAVAVGADGAIWIADTGNGRVRVVAPNGRLWTAAEGLKPIDIVVGPHGKVFILDELGRQVLRLGPAPRFDDGVLVGAGTLSVVHRFDDDTSTPAAIDVAADGTLYVADRGRRQVLVLDSQPRAVAGNGTARASGDGTHARNAALYAPAGMAFAADGTLFFADRLNHLIRRVGVDGIIRSVDGPSLHEPGDVAFDAQGRLFIADTGNDRVLRIAADGRVVVVVGALSGHSLSRPTALAFDGDGRLLIADSGHRVVRRLENDGTLTTLAGNGNPSPIDDGGPATASALVRPVDVKVDGRGTVWIADAGAHRVYRLGADGLLRLVAGTGQPGVGPAGSLAHRAPLNTPTGVEPDGAGGVIIADSGNGRLIHVDADGVLRLVAHEGVGQPTRLSTTPGGDIIFTDGLTHRILQLSVRRDVAPVSQRVVVEDTGWTVETLAALPLAHLQQVITHPQTGVPLVTSQSSVSAIAADGSRQRLLGSEASRFRAGGIAVDDFGASLLLVTAPGEGQPKPMTLVRFLGDTERDAERFDLEFLFEGADAMAVGAGGSVFLHQADDGTGGGRLLRLRRERLLNIPGFPQAVGGQGVSEAGIEAFAALPAEAAVLAAAPGGGVYVGLRGSRDIILVRDLDGDGRARGSLEQQRLVKVPEAPVALAVTTDGALWAATEANRIYRIDGNTASLVAHGFAPLLLDLAPTADGVLLVLEGDARGGRLLALAPARPSLAVWPTRLNFGAGPLGVTVTSTIVLRNDGPLAVRVSPETASGQPLDVGGDLRLAPGEVRQVEARWMPRVPGQTSDELRWRDGSGRVLVRLPVAIHGRAPRVEAPADLDLGTVWVGGEFVATIELRNGGDAELRVEGLELVSVSGTGFSVHAAATTVAPGADLTLSVVLAPPRRATYTATLRVHTNDPLRPVHEVSLRGIGGRAQLTVTDVELGVLPVGRRQSRELLLTNTGDLDLRIHSILSGTRQLILTPLWLTVPAGGTQTVRIDFTPAAHGEVTGELTLMTNDPAHPLWTIPFHGRGVSRWLDVSALAHDFGAVSSPQRWAVQITNFHQRPLTLLDASIDNGAFRVIERPRSIEPGGTGTVVVEFRPQAVTESRGQLLLRTDLIEAPEVAVTLRGRARAAGQIRLELEAANLSLWPGEDLGVAVQVVDAMALRGAVLTVVASAGIALSGFDFPEGSLLRQAGEPLAVVDTGDGMMRVGLSLTGAADGSVTGSGRLGVLRLSTDGRLAPTITVRLSGAVARSAVGVDDTLAVAPGIELQPRWKGDVNGDGRLDLTDVFVLVDALSAPVTEAERELYDLDEDGILGSGDVQILIDHLPASAKAAGSWDATLSVEPTLMTPFPNPFNSETVLVASLPEPAHVELSIHNLLGQRIRVLRSRPLPAGVIRILWNGVDDDGHAARSGVYFAVLEAAGRRSVQRLLLVR